MNAVIEDNSSPVRPVYFQMSCKSDETDRRIKTLYQLAQESHFESLSSVFVLNGDDCSICSDDPLEEMKIRARASLRIGNDIVSIHPDRIVGFVAQMPNRENFCVGFCLYPKTIVIDGHQISTGLGDRAYWSNFVQTVVFDHSRDENIDECVQSHRCVCRVLKQAEFDGILGVVVDPTLFWNLDELLLLESTIRSALDSHASLADTGVH